MRALQVNINCTKYSCGTCDFKSKLQGHRNMKCLLFSINLKLRTVNNYGMNFHRTEKCIDAERSHYENS